MALNDGGFLNEDIMRARKIPINQLIIFVVFLSAALIASLFVYHLSHKTDNANLSSDKGIIFSVARDIKPFELVTTENKPFTLQNFYHHWSLVFFGFTHCASVCPTTLELMKHAYNKLHTRYPDLQVVLVSVDPERDTPQSLTRYTHAFHPDFIGVTGKIAELRKLQSQLGIFAARDDSTGSDYQIQHTSSILLITPQGKWAGMFKFGLTPEALVQSIEEGIRFSSIA